MGAVITCCMYVADQFIAAHSDSFDGFANTNKCCLKPLMAKNTIFTRTGNGNAHYVPFGDKDANNA